MDIETLGLEGLDKNKIANEVLQWLIDHVEDYIDNKETVFSIYFPIDAEITKQLEQTNKLGKIFIDILEKGDKNKNIKKTQEDIKILDEYVEEIKDIMQENKEKIEQLFKRLIYYYEMIGVHKINGPIIQELDGFVKINNFTFESIGLDIKITKKWQRMTKDGRFLESNKPPEVIKEEHVPEGFAVEIELNKWPRTSSVSLL